MPPTQCTDIARGKRGVSFCQKGRERRDGWERRGAAGRLAPRWVCSAAMASRSTRRSARLRIGAYHVDRAANPHRWVCSARLRRCRRGRATGPIRRSATARPALHRPGENSGQHTFTVSVARFFGRTNGNAGPEAKADAPTLRLSDLEVKTYPIGILRQHQARRENTFACGRWGDTEPPSQPDFQQLPGSTAVPRLPDAPADGRRLGNGLITDETLHINCQISFNGNKGYAKGRLAPGDTNVGSRPHTWPARASISSPSGGNELKAVFLACVTMNVAAFVIDFLGRTV